MTVFNDVGELRTALSTSATDHSFYIEPGSVMALGGTALTIDGGNFTLSSAREGAVIDAESLSRCIEVRSGYLRLINIRLINGFSRDGGGMRVDGAEVHLVNTTISHCRAEGFDDKYGTKNTGGGISLRSGWLVLEDSTIRDCIVQGPSGSGKNYGGGIVHFSGDLRVYGSRIERCHVYATNGVRAAGGAYRADRVYGASISAEWYDSIISNCSVTSYNGLAEGGAARIGAYGASHLMPRFVRCTITGCRAISRADTDDAGLSAQGGALCVKQSGEDGAPTEQGFVVEDSTIEDCEAIGINAAASGGAAYFKHRRSVALVMRNSTVSRCRARGLTALGGAVAMDHSTSVVEIYSTLIQHCEARADGSFAAGGAIHVRLGQLLLAEGTSMRHNFLTDVSGEGRGLQEVGAHNLSGASLYVGAALVIYLLPTPAAHWLQAIYCEKVFNPCPDYCVDSCTLPGEATDNPSCTLTLYSLQPCPWQYEDHLGSANGWERLIGSWVQVIPPGALDDSEFPMPCVPGYYATPGDVAAQKSSNCGGPCPEGHFCPNAATTEPVVCPQGMYCPSGSSVPLPVPAGTSWSGVGLARASEAPVVPSGYFSSAGQIEPTPCGAAAFYCPGEGNSVPQIVRPGQISLPADGDPRTRTAEAPCPSGHWCSNGVAIACQQGFYSDLSLPVKERTSQSSCAACPLHMTTTGLAAASKAQCVCESGRVALAEADGRVVECGCPAGTVYSFGADSCISCNERTWSRAGSSECSMCAEGYYRESAAIGVSTATCLPCPRGAHCDVNSTLQTFSLLEGFWRLETTSPEPLECDDVDKVAEGSRSVCLAGSAKGNCSFGHAGPLCTVCTEDDHYFDEAANICKDCPGVGGVSGMYGGILAALLVLCAFLWVVLARPPPCLEPLKKLLISLYLYLRSLGLQPKLKMALSFYQVVTVMDSTYGVELPDSYTRWMKHFAFIGQLDWAFITIPEGCLFPGGFRQSLIFTAVAPLVIIGGFLVFGLVTAALQGCLDGYQRREDDLEESGILQRILRRGVIAAMPPCILTTFVFVPGVSASIFSAWSCEAYDLSETEQVYYLRDDYAVVCYDSEEHREIRRIASVLVALWPIGMVVLYAVLLVPVAKPITQRRSSALTKATAFLWRDYEVDYFWWEPLELLRRTALTGWVLLLPEKKRFLRLVTGLLVSLLSSFGLLISKPFSREEDDMLSIMCQVLLVCVYLGALLVDTFNNFVAVGSSIQPDDPESVAARYLGFSSSTNVVTLMITFSVTVVILAATSALWRMWREGLVANLRVIRTKTAPETGFGKKIRFHLFLSHQWGDCQDSAAVIKRQLQRLVPGASIFLDVDDLADISKLEEYIDQTAVVLLMLSRSYFASRNCMREVEQSVKQKKRLVLLHEADVGHGGAPLSQLKAMCPEEFREDVFAPHNLLVQWHRVSIFQLETLKLIAEQMLLEMPRYERDLEVPLFAPNSMMTKAHMFATPVVVYTSPFNPGAAEVALEMSSVFNAAEGLHGDKMIEKARAENGYFAAAKAAAQVSQEEAASSTKDSQDGSKALQVGAQATARGGAANLKFRYTSAQPAALAEAIRGGVANDRTLSCGDSKRKLSKRTRRSQQKSKSDGLNLSSIFHDEPSAVKHEPCWSDYRPKMRVRHQQLGEGVVTGLSEGRLQVDFDCGESHRYASHSLTQLKILSETIPEDDSGRGVEAPSPADGGGSAAQATTPDGPGQPTATHFLLYLSKHTFMGGAGLELSHEVRAALHAKLEIVLMHETAEPDGCEFNEVISHTPADLLEKGLYSQIATPLHAGLHRAVSLLLAAKAMGATATKGSFLVQERRKAAVQKVSAKLTRLNKKSPGTKIVTADKLATSSTADS